MRKQLQDILKQLNEAEYIELRDCLAVAGNVRSLKREYGLTDSQISGELDVDISDVKAYLTGAYPYTVKDIAKIQAFAMRLESTKKQK